MYAQHDAQAFQPETGQLSEADGALAHWDVGRMRALAERERSVQARVLFGRLGSWLGDLAISRRRR